MSRLTSKESKERALKIRKLHDTGKYTIADLSRKFCISDVYCGKIVNGLKCVTIAKPKGNWKDITLYGRNFSISDDGRVWAYATNKFIKFRNNGGYNIIHIMDDVHGIKRNIKIHRLVLTLFKRPPKTGEVARHLDDDKSNNHISNLEWGYHLDNVEDGHRNDVYAKGIDVFTSKLSEKQVKKFVDGYSSGSMEAYCRSYKEKHNIKVSVKQMLSILKGRYWSHVTGIVDYQKKFCIKLDEKAVRYIHKCWRRMKSKGEQQQTSCKHMAEFLNTKGYNVAWRTVKKALNGHSFKDIYLDFNG